MDYRSALQRKTQVPNIYFGNLDDSKEDLDDDEDLAQENSDDEDFPLNQQDLCHKEGGYVRLIIVVTCSVDVFNKRHAIRETWGSYTKQIDMGVRVAFLTGRTLNKTIQQQLEEENEKYHDIIQGNFLDTYRNLTLKSILLQKWIATYCSSAQYALKSDDDMFVHVPNLLSGLRRVKYPRFFFCSLQVGASPIRNKKSKWFVPKGEFPQGRYPNYCSGSAYSFSVNIAADLYSKSKETPVFWLEDIYITGILAKKVSMRHIHNKGFQFWKTTIGKPCSFKKVITSHRVSPSVLRSLWKAIHRHELKC
jgi:beta-1,3-galactosyltransferase 1